jgi:hypothetical protein
MGNRNKQLSENGSDAKQLSKKERKNDNEKPSSSGSSSTQLGKKESGNGGI